MDRWALARRLNGLVAAWAQGDECRHWIDVAAPSANVRGHRRPELFLADSLHLSPAGYALWTSVLRLRLIADLGSGTDLEMRKGLDQYSRSNTPAIPKRHAAGATATPPAP